MSDKLPCGAEIDHDCPFWECCAWGQREYIDIPTGGAEQ